MQGQGQWRSQDFTDGGAKEVNARVSARGIFEAMPTSGHVMRARPLSRLCAASS